MSFTRFLPPLGWPVRLSVLGALLALPISVAGVNVFVALTLVLALLSREFWISAPKLIRDPVVLMTLAILSLFALGVTYSSAPETESLNFFHRYRKLVILPFVVPFFLEDKHKKIAWVTFVLSSFATVIISWTEFKGLTHLSDPAFGDMTGDSVFKMHITQGYLFALVIAGSAVMVASSQRWIFKLFWSLVFLVTTADISWVMWGKTGKATLVALGVWLCFECVRRIPFRGLFKVTTFFLGIALVLGSAIYVMKHPELSLGIARIEVQQSLHHDGTATSQGLRIQFVRTGLKIIRSSPWIGHGTGSIGTEYEAYAKLGATPVEQVITNNLHDEYLMQWAQLGVTGIMLFLGILMFSWWRSFRLILWQGMALRGLLVVFAFGCLFNSYLLDFAEGYSFLLLLSVLIPL